MNMVRAAGSSGNSKNKSDVNTVTTAKQNVTNKSEAVKVVEKEKKQPTAEQIRIASLTDKNDTPTSDLSIKIKKIKDVTCKSDDDIATALYDCDNNEDAAITYLLEGKQDGWETTTKKKKNRTASTSKNDAHANNHGESNENAEDWDREGNTSANHPSEKNNRNFKGRRGGGRPNDRGSFNRTRWRGRENKENERGTEDSSNATSGPNRDYRGRGDRLTNGPSRLSRGFRGARGGRGPGGTRTFQSRDNNDKSGGGFPRQIDTWNNPETDNAPSKMGEFPSPEDWDNEEYTGSLADTKVFTPSTTIEPETVDTVAAVEGETKDESLQLHMSLQSPSNATIPSLGVGSNQLTAAQTQYFKQLTAQANENRKQQAAAVQQQPPVAVQQVVVQPNAPQQVQQQQQQSQQPQSSVIYNSSISSPQQSFSNAVTQPSYSGVSQSYPSVTPSQSFTAMVSSQTFQQSPSSSYQSPSSISAGSTSYSRTAAEFTSSNYSEVMNYSSMVGLQTNGALPQRSKPQRPTSRQETPTKVMAGSVDMPATDGSINAMKYLDTQFNALDFNNSDGFENAANGNEQGGVTALSNKYSQSANAATHTDLPSMNPYQSAAQPPKQNLPSSTMVLSQNSKLSAENNLQNENSVYSSQTITNSRMAPSIQDLKNNTEVSSLSSYGLPDAYQSQQPQSTFQKTASNASSSFHQPGTSVSNYNSSTYGATAPITSTATNVYSGQQQTSQSQQQSQISGAGVTYTTNSSTSFSVYSNTSHTVATPTPPIHNSVYHNSSYQSHPSVTASFQSYGLYPSSIMQPYQAGAAGLTQTPYLSTQYGGGSLAGLGTYGAAPFHNNYGVGSNLQTPVANLPQSHKISSSLSTSVASKESQYDSLQAITSASNNTATTTSGSVISGLSQTSTTTSSKVSSSSSSGGKSSSVLPSIPPGVAPLMGPQYIMSQGVPVYQPAFAVNYDDLQYLQRGMHPHMPTGYLDWPQTNIAAAGRDALSVPFSSISDGRFQRPDNTTSPVPPTAAAAAAGASLPQQNTAPAHQQPHVPLLQTYATAYIYPGYQQYTAPAVYQVAPTGTPTAPGSSNSAALTATQFAKAPTGYSSTAYASQYDSLGSNQGNVADYGSKGNSANTYSNTQPPSKTNSSAGSVSSQNANAGNADLSMYGKSHTSLTKSYDKQTFHSGTPPPFTMPGSGTTSSNLGSNASGASGYGTQLYISGGVPTAAAAAHQQHHLHQNAHHQDDIRSTGSNERNFFMSNSRSSYR